MCTAVAAAAAGTSTKYSCRQEPGSNSQRRPNHETCCMLNHSAFLCNFLQVNVAETETEDQAVKRYMRAVVQSGVINKVGICCIHHSSSWRFEVDLISAQVSSLGSNPPSSEAAQQLCWEFQRVWRPQDSTQQHQTPSCVRLVPTVTSKLKQH